MTVEPYDFSHALHLANLSLQRGDRLEARRWASRANAADPGREEGWLILAAVASPNASLAYVERALAINPASSRARAALDWARQRQAAGQAYRPIPAAQPAALPPPPRIQAQVAPQDFIRRRQALWPWAVAAAAVIAAAIWFGGLPLPGLASFAFPAAQVPQVAQAHGKATASPTPLPTATPTPSATPTALPTQPPTAIPATPTEVVVVAQAAEPTAAPTEKPAKKKKKAKTPKKQAPAAPQYGSRPPGVDGNERWVDVDLSSQTAYAMQGDTMVKAFVVSTGTWATPTVTGKFRVYVKYKYANMSGPGYFLPDVPNVMYFYEGYGLHGTYWHNNFGTPMSHGCVNFSIPDSDWIFDFASVGTVVSVHN